MAPTELRWLRGALLAMLCETISMAAAAALLLASGDYVAGALSASTATLVAISIALHLGSYGTKLPEPESVPNAPNSTPPSILREDPVATVVSASDASPQPQRGNSFAAMNSSLSSISSSPVAWRMQQPVVVDRRAVVVASASGMGGSSSQNPLESPVMEAVRQLETPVLSRMSSVNDVKRPTPTLVDIGPAAIGLRDSRASSIFEAGPITLHHRGSIPLRRQSATDLPVIDVPLFVPIVSVTVVSSLCFVLYAAFATVATVETGVTAFSVAIVGGASHVLLPWLHGHLWNRIAAVTCAGVGFVALALTSIFVMEPSINASVRGGAVTAVLFACTVSPVIRLLGTVALTVAETIAIAELESAERSIWDTLAGKPETFISQSHLTGFGNALSQLTRAYLDAKQFVPDGAVSDSSASNNERPLASRASAALRLGSSALLSELGSNGIVRGKLAMLCCRVGAICHDDVSRNTDTSALYTAYSVIEMTLSTFSCHASVFPGSGMDVYIVVRYSSTSDRAAAEAAVRIGQSLVDGFQREALNVSLSIVSGVATVAVFGSRPKSLRLVGELVDSAASLCSLAEALKMSILCDEDIAAECLLTHWVNPVDLAQLPTWPNPRVLYRVVRSFESAPEHAGGIEWMYHIQNVAAQVPSAAWNLRRAFLAFARADFNGATQILRAIRADEHRDNAVAEIERHFEVELSHLEQRILEVGSRGAASGSPSTFPAATITMALGIGVPPETGPVCPICVLRPRQMWL